ncbi:MAG: type IV pilus secretin PilQ [Candidatus Omnitrophica bacterium]|nr:type IV pilus secretin PilQ [Candidatus Omnitrophota bacterium]
MKPKIIFLLFLVAATILPFALVLAQEEPELIINPQPEEAKQVTAPVEPTESGLVTMDFENADIRDVIRVIALASGLNMVIGHGVDAKVTMSLKEVPWETALDIILRTYNFTYKREANLIRIMTFEKLKQEERDIPLTTKLIYLNFADVGVIQGTLSSMLSERGSIQTDARTNSMLVTDIPDKVAEVEEIAKTLDTRTPQVLIEAMLVDVKLTKDDELGINWKIIHVNRPIEQGTSPNYIEQPQSTMNVSNASITFHWLKEFGGYDLDGVINAWVQDAKANVLASPKIVTLDNQTARIEIKSQVPYTQYAQSDQGSLSATTQFKDVVVGMEVTPHITKEGYVSMNLKPKQEFQEGTTSDGQPYIGSRSAETNVLVKDGETIVIGGLRKVEDSTTVSKVPILGDIPYLGALFRKKDAQRINTELVMFVTPHIITQSGLSDEEKIKFQMLDEAREDFLKQQERERQTRLKESKKQALLVSPAIIKEDLSLPMEEAAKEEIKEQAPGPEQNQDYIYVW